MRLIDADALMKVYAPYEFMADMGDAMEILANFPTVDAIPVSFLLKLQETAVNDEASEIINEIIARWERERKEE